MSGKSSIVQGTSVGSGGAPKMDLLLAKNKMGLVTHNVKWNVETK